MGSDAVRSLRSINCKSLITSVAFSIGGNDTLRHGGGDADEEGSKDDLRLHFDKQLGC